LVGGVGVNRPRSGCASRTAHSSKRCSRRATRYALYMRSCATRCARTSSLSNSYYVCIYRRVGFFLSILLGCIIWSGLLGLTSLLFAFSEPASNPPPRDLKVSDPTVRDLTLGELGLAPSSILHFRFVDDGLNRAFFFLFLFPPCRVQVALPCPALTPSP
jgi:hypothetical protein